MEGRTEVTDVVSPLVDNILVYSNPVRIISITDTHKLSTRLSCADNKTRLRVTPVSWRCTSRVVAPAPKRARHASPLGVIKAMYYYYCSRDFMRTLSRTSDVMFTNGIHYLRETELLNSLVMHNLGIYVDSRGPWSDGVRLVPYRTRLQS